MSIERASRAGRQQQRQEGREDGEGRPRRRADVAQGSRGGLARRPRDGATRLLAIRRVPVRAGAATMVRLSFDRPPRRAVAGRVARVARYRP